MHSSNCSMQTAVRSVNTKVINDLNTYSSVYTVYNVYTVLITVDATAKGWRRKNEAA